MRLRNLFDDLKPPEFRGGTPEAKARAKAQGFNVDQVFYHANTGGIRGKGFDNSRLPAWDPDAPFNAHWFSAEASEFAAYPSTGNAITPCWLRLTRPVPVELVYKLQKKFRNPSELREKMSDMGYTHIVWRGHFGIDFDELEKTGQTIIRHTRGGKFLLKPNRYQTGPYGHDLPEYWVDGYAAFPIRKDGTVAEHTDYHFHDIEHIKRSMPQYDAIAMFHPKDIKSIFAQFDPAKTNDGGLMESAAPVIQTKPLRRGRYSFSAMIDGKVVATGEFQSNTMTNVGSVEDITVHSEYRRRGIATAIYNHFEKMGFKVVPSDDVKPDGERFWDARGRW